MVFVANFLYFQANRILAGIKPGDKVKVEQVGHKKLLTTPDYRKVTKHKLPDCNTSINNKYGGSSAILGYLSPSIDDLKLVRFNPASSQVHNSNYYQRYLRFGTLLI
jgi:hypothetical protein